jgi:hypothetical protein
MGGAIRFDCPAGQQQPHNDTENQLFLFRQAIHGTNITESQLTASPCMIGVQASACYDRESQSSNSNVHLRFAGRREMKQNP